MQFFWRVWVKTEHFAEACCFSGIQVEFLKMGLAILGSFPCQELVLTSTMGFLLAAGEVAGRHGN